MIFGLNDLTSRACANCTWQTGNASVLVKALRENNFTVAGAYDCCVCVCVCL